MTTRRYPLDALVSASGLSEAAMARHVGMSGAGLKGARSGGLTLTTADRYAVKLGLHPAEVWDDWWEVTPVPCGNDRCTELVLDDRFCSRRCGVSVRGRARYHAQKSAALASSSPQTTHAEVAA